MVLSGTTAYCLLEVFVTASESYVALVSDLSLALIVPVVVIGPPVRPTPVAIFVTVPDGSSPDGITIQVDPLDTTVSPVLYVTGDVASDIAL